MNPGFLDKSLFTFEDAVRSGLTKQGAASALRRYEKQGRIKKLRRGLYALINPVNKGVFASNYEIATALHPEGTVAYHTALEYYGFGHQAYFEAYVLCPSRYHDEEVDGLTFRFFLKTIDEGVEEEFGPSSAMIRVTDMERTVVDCLDRVDLCGGFEELCHCLSPIVWLNERKLLRYLSLYAKKALYQKAGFVLSLLDVQGLHKTFYDTCLGNIGAATVDLCATGEKGQRDPKWRVKAPILNDLMEID